MTAMPNIASILKSEISRVARKEVRAEIESLRKASVQYRAAIAGLRRQIVELEKEVRRSTKSRPQSDPSAGPVAVDGEATGTPRRFSPARLAAVRLKTGLSAAVYGQLVGVSGQTVYNWEQGKSRPNPVQIAKLAEVRELGRTELHTRVAELLAK